MEEDGQSLVTGVVFSEEHGSWGWAEIRRVVRDGLLGRGFVLHAERSPHSPTSCCAALAALARPGLGRASVCGLREGVCHCRIQGALTTVGQQSPEPVGRGAQPLPVGAEQVAQVSSLAALAVVFNPLCFGRLAHADPDSFLSLCLPLPSRCTWPVLAHPSASPQISFPSEPPP